MTLLGDGFKPANYFNSYFMPTGGEYQRQDLRVTFKSATDEGQGQSDLSGAPRQGRCVMKRLCRNDLLKISRSEQSQKTCWGKQWGKQQGDFARKPRNPKQQRGTPSHIVSQLPYNLSGSGWGAWQN